MWQSVGQIKSRFYAQKYKKDYNKFIFGSLNVLNFTVTIYCFSNPLYNVRYFAVKQYYNLL